MGRGGGGAREAASGATRDEGSSSGAPVGQRWRRRIIEWEREEEKEKEEPRV